MAMGKFEEGLYDFSTAAKIEKDGPNDPKTLGNYLMFAGTCCVELG